MVNFMTEELTTRLILGDSDIKAKRVASVTIKVTDIPSILVHLNIHIF